MIIYFDASLKFVFCVGKVYICYSFIVVFSYIRNLINVAHIYFVSIILKNGLKKKGLRSNCILLIQKDNFFKYIIYYACPISLCIAAGDDVYYSETDEEMEERASPSRRSPQSPQSR